MPPVAAPPRPLVYNTRRASIRRRPLASLTIPACHDVARRLDAGFAERLPREHWMEEDEAHAVAADLA